MNTPAPTWTPTIAQLPNGDWVRITAVRAREIVFDRLAGEDGVVVSNAHSAPFAGYDPQIDPLPAVGVVVDAIAQAIANPVPLPVPSRRQRTDIILQRLTETERGALFTARKNVWQLDYLITRAASTGEIHEDDADFPLARATLDQLGIVAAARWDALFAP